MICVVQQGGSWGVEKDTHKYTHMQVLVGKAQRRDAVVLPARSQHYTEGPRLEELAGWGQFGVGWRAGWAWWGGWPNGGGMTGRVGQGEGGMSGWVGPGGGLVASRVGVG